MKEISIVWSTEDILYQAEEDKVKLTEVQADEILDILKAKHDATIGISWEVITTITDLYINGHYDR